MAWGSTILSLTRNGRMPSAKAASVCPRGTAFMPARNTSASTPEAASATGRVIIQNDDIRMPYCGTTKKKK